MKFIYSREIINFLRISFLNIVCTFVCKHVMSDENILSTEIELRPDTTMGIVILHLKGLICDWNILQSLSIQDCLWTMQ